MIAKRFSVILAFVVIIQLVFAFPIAGFEKEHHHCEGEHCPVCMMMLVLQENHCLILNDIYKKSFFLIFSVASLLLLSKTNFETISLFSLKKKITS